MSSYAMLWEQEFQARLDADARRRERAHTEALRAATAEHDRIREVAESVRQQAELQAALERQLELDRERDALTKLQREAEQQQRAIQEAELRRVAEEEAARRQAEQRRIQLKEQLELERRRQEQADREATEARRRKLEEEETAAAEAQKKKEEEERAKKAAAQASIARAQQANNAAKAAVAPSTTLSQLSTNGVAAAAAAPVSTSPADPSKEAEHSRYVAIHKNMKELRTWMVDQAKSNPSLKTAMGDARREIRKNIGQLTSDNKKNIEKRGKIIELLVSGGRVAQPTTDITKFLADPPPSSPQTQVPALLIYLMNIFIKALMRQFVGEGGVKLSTANPVGIIGSYILSFDTLKWQGRPLTDMLLAKFHVACPVLFGIYGPESTDEGKRRIGWKLSKDYTGRAGSWITPQDHADRMQGLGAGFAALSLRSYEKSKQSNPLPPWHFWRAVACITNVPAGQVQPSHCYVLRAMMLDTETRILEFFGNYGLLMLRYALVQFPRKAPSNSPATQQLALLAGQLAKDGKLQLAG